MSAAALPDISLQGFLARTTEEGDCLLWDGYAAEGKFPQWRIDGKLHAVRRLVWELTRGPLGRGIQVGVNCRCDLCVHPDHLVARTKAKAMAHVPLSPDRRLRIAMARRAKSSLSIDLVRQIRASTEPGNVLEQRHGLQTGYASRIRLGKVWADHASPFSGLGGRRP
jgi:hypothetical protein